MSTVYRQTGKNSSGGHQQHSHNTKLYASPQISGKKGDELGNPRTVGPPVGHGKNWPCHSSADPEAYPHHFTVTHYDAQGPQVGHHPDENREDWPASVPIRKKCTGYHRCTMRVRKGKPNCTTYTSVMPYLQQPEGEDLGNG